MSLNNVLAKLTQEDKLEIMRQLIILPTIEEDHSLSAEELSNIVIAGGKMGFNQAEIMTEVNKQADAIGAVIEK